MKATTVFPTPQEPIVPSTLPIISGNLTLGEELILRRQKIRKICQAKGYKETDIPIREDKERSSLYRYSAMNLFICMYSFDFTFQFKLHLSPIFSPPKSGSTFSRFFLRKTLNYLNETKRILSRQPGGTNFGNYEVANFHVVNAVPMKKVALFRHPIERLLSGWNQMFQDRCEEPCGKHPVSVLV